MDLKIYVGTYAKYNDGNLKGEWVNLADFSDEDEFLEKCREIHSDEDDPELMFQDKEFDHDLSFWFSESKIDPQIFEFASEADSLDNNRIEAFIAYMDNYQTSYKSDSFQESWERFEEMYQGKYDKKEDFADECAEQNGWFQAMEKAGMNISYFDSESYAIDLFIDGYTWCDGHVFRDY